MAWWCIYNRSREIVLARRGRAATSYWSRLVGLMGRARLEADEALWLQPCNWVHTLGMRFAIDVLYLDRQGQVLRAIPELVPQRLGPPVWPARAVVELPAGTIARTSTRAGDWVEICPTKEER